jgi:hypothetical protein
MFSRILEYSPELSPRERCIPTKKDTWEIVKR